MTDINRLSNPPDLADTISIAEENLIEHSKKLPGQPAANNNYPDVHHHKHQQLHQEHYESPEREPKASDSLSHPTSKASSTLQPTSNPLVDPFPNGYHFPPKKPLGQMITEGLKDLWQYTLTPLGFFVVLYCLNVAAWGAMIFFLLLKAAPALCRPNCEDIESPRRKWIEIDAQVLNALFCVTGFGLAPWRFRDLFFLLLGKRRNGLRKLARVHKSWLRLPGSDTLPPHLGPDNVADAPPGSYNVEATPFPAQRMAVAPRTGVRAPPTKPWKVHFVVWFNVLNTLVQVVLSFFMWHYDRYTRAGWAQGLFTVLGMLTGAMAGGMMALEGRHVKRVEGVPVSEEERLRLLKDREMGIAHWNNLGDKKPKHIKKQEKQEKKQQRTVVKSG